MSTTANDKSVSELTPLLTKIIDEMNKNNLSVSDMSNLFSKFIEEKTSNNIPNSKIAGFTKNTELNTAEVCTLWNQYMGDSLAICMYKYFLNIVENKEVKSIIETALELSQSHITQITEFFNQAKFQVPMGFKGSDININAPRLFTDDFFVFYTEIMTMHGLTGYSLAITISEREDIRNYFLECTTSAKDLIDKVIKYGQSSGKYSTIPSIPSPKQVEFIQKTSFISDLLGDKRPLNASEITNLFFNTKKNVLNKTLFLAFSQVAENEDVRDFMLFGVEKAGKDIDSFIKILQGDHLSPPLIWDNAVTNSTASPFSDKLMMFHMVFLTSAALAFYGSGLATSMRLDLVSAYNSIFANIHTGSKKMYLIMTKYGWLEKQPEAIDRKLLAKGTNK